jgi:hypothetical protein
MDEDKVHSCDHVLVADSTRTRELEARYVQLLEKRIAALEESEKDQTRKLRVRQVLFLPICLLIFGLHFLLMFAFYLP